MAIKNSYRSLTIAGIISLIMLWPALLSKLKFSQAINHRQDSLTRIRIMNYIQEFVDISCSFLVNKISLLFSICDQ